MSKKKPKPKFYPHKFTRKIRHWFYCDGCGLIALRNEPTQQRIKEGCDVGDED